MVINFLIQKYEDKLFVLQNYLKLCQKHNSYYQCLTTQVQIDTIKEFLETLKTQ